MAGASTLFARYIPKSAAAPKPPHVDCGCVSCDTWRVKRVKPGSYMQAAIFQGFDSPSRKVRAWPVTGDIPRLASTHDDQMWLEVGERVLVIGDDPLPSSTWRNSCAVVMSTVSGIVIVHKRTLVPII